MPDIMMIITTTFFLRALIAVILISFITGVIGSFTVFRGLTFITATIAHSVWAGAALGLLIQLYIAHWINPLIVTTLVGVLTALFISFLSREDITEKFDVAIGVTFALSMSFAILLISMLREYASMTFGLIVGDILLLSFEDLIYLVILTTITIFLTILFLNQFIFISFDMEGAKAIGLNVEIYQTIMFVLIALSVVVMVKGVGAILVYAILTIPPAAANEIAENVFHAMILAFIFALISGLLGLLLSVFVNVAPSALMGLISVIIYILVKIFK